jgi:hypothetical protein
VNSNFLSSAANLLMGVGLPGGSRGSQDQRYDGYKQISSIQSARRY